MQEVKRLLESCPASADRGKGVLMRLKYLYEAKQFDTLIQEAPAYESDDLCKPYLPQIFYLRWVSYRQLNQPQDAQKIQDAFLTRFPEHPLGADMHFASAVTALAASNYPEAQRLLDIIPYRYPQSKLLPKVKDMQKRLTNLSPPTPPP